MDSPTVRPMGIVKMRGFTLIELLVVIAIIGLLTSIVLVALGNSRSSAADSSIKSNLSIVRSQAEIYALANGNTYGVLAGGLSAPGGATSVCLNQSSGNLYADPTIKAALAAAQLASGGTIRCFSDGSSWQVAVQLKTTPGFSWCSASNGVAKQVLTTNVLLLSDRSCL